MAPRVISIPPHPQRRANNRRSNGHALYEAIGGEPLEPNPRLHPARDLARARGGRPRYARRGGDAPRKPGVARAPLERVMSAPMWRPFVEPLCIQYTMGDDRRGLSA